jgi:hypothetical protein
LQDQRVGIGFATILWSRYPLEIIKQRFLGAKMPNELNPPANFDLYQTRRDLTAKRNAEKDPVKREQINLLLEQLENLDKAEPERKASLTKAIEIQLGVIRGECKMA